jgi:hypothetical protein
MNSRRCPDLDMLEIVKDGLNFDVGLFNLQVVRIVDVASMM